MSTNREDLTKAFPKVKGHGHGLSQCVIGLIATEEVRRIEVECSFCVVRLAITLLDSKQLHSIKIVRQGLTAGGYSM